MSVYTPVNRLQLEQFFSTYSLGEVTGFEGIKDGIENTNYFVTTTQGRFVLTLFESLTADDLPPFMELMTHLGSSEIACPAPLPGRQPNPLRILNNKPAALFNRLAGAAVASPSIAHCRQIGLHLARLHCATQDYVFPIRNSRGLNWCRSVFAEIGASLCPADRALIDDELRIQFQNSADLLPRGVIHADLFRDNVLFVDGRLSGLLDFYSACTDTLLLDIAITANDWCCDNGIVNPEKITNLLSAYETLRPLEPQERRHWPLMLRAAALRFWLSRLHHRLHPRPGEITQQKDPLIFRHILEQHRRQTSVISPRPAAWPSCFRPAADTRRRTDSDDLECGTDCTASS
ncbi:homoserine kinase [Methylobacter sp. YRD-M1]|uniref:homoserine kinase n=1 Tax=Methylobacter sp. YRD-M1 TaxID=2911520 RepID=UPI00227A25AC|nr:homoserine kinase [Methylobacter sp. YRD-M1]WAK01931.1 homoserine kinase [Methylobacter sp. YRD-M1]